jgi:hypothetical protein
LATVQTNAPQSAVDADNDPIHGSSSGCLALWYAVLEDYIGEARRAARVRAPKRLNSVLADLGGNQRQLRWICSFLPIDPDWLAWKLLDHITTPAIEIKSL